jgi:hypothetical protein
MSAEAKERVSAAKFQSVRGDAVIPRSLAPHTVPPRTN